MDAQNLRQVAWSLCYGLGVYNVSSLAYKLYRFGAAQLSSSSIPRYLHDTPEKPSWALVTSASDGIGFGFAEELATHDFNVILHGRNPAKLDNRIVGLQKRFPERSFRKFVASPQDGTGEWSKLVDELPATLKADNINLTVLVNNVGGSGRVQPSYVPLQARSATDVTDLIDLNASFPAQITRVLLPILLQNQPSLIVNVGSVTAALPAPYLSIYGASKAFDMAFSRSLRAEMRAEGHDVEVLAINVGSVQNSGRQGVPETLFTPSSRNMAKAALNVVGCGHESVTGYWPHALQVWAYGLLPESVAEALVISLSKKEQARESQGMKDASLLQGEKGKNE